MIQADPQRYQSILKMLEQLDKPPRQILLDAKIYSIDLTDQFASGVSAYFQNSSAGRPSGLGLAPFTSLCGRHRDTHRRNAGQRQPANCWAP